MLAPAPAVDDEPMATILIGWPRRQTPRGARERLIEARLLGRHRAGGLARRSRRGCGAGSAAGVAAELRSAHGPERARAAAAQRRSKRPLDAEKIPCMT